jgi:hypothetical protein
MIPFRLWGDALWCGQEVVGASEHEAAIRSLLPSPLPGRGADLDTVADLVPEPDNRFDPYAVAVRVAEKVVGYLPQEDARHYQPVLADLVEQGFQPQAPCRVSASEWEAADWDRRGLGLTEYHASVALALAQPHMLVPLNLPPAGSYQPLPHGTATVVPMDRDGFELIVPYFRPEGECWVYATLHAIEHVSAKSGKLAVEVRLDGERVGQLGPRCSADFLPAVQYLADLRSETAARMVVRGNPLNSELVLYAARANELPATWPDGLTRTPVATAKWQYWLGGNSTRL